MITGPSAGGDHDDNDGGDDDDYRDGDSDPPAAALLLGTIAIRPHRSVPVALDVVVAARVRVPTGGLRRACRLALAGTPALLRPGVAIPVALAGGRIVRICVPTWLSPFDQVNSSSTALGPTSFARWMPFVSDRTSTGRQDRPVNLSRKSHTGDRLRRGSLQESRDRLGLNVMSPVVRRYTQSTRGHSDRPLVVLAGRAPMSPPNITIGSMRVDAMAVFRRGRPLWVGGAGGWSSLRSRPDPSHRARAVGTGAGGEEGLLVGSLGLRAGIGRFRLVQRRGL